MSSELLGTRVNSSQVGMKECAHIPHQVVKIDESVVAGQRLLVSGDSAKSVKNNEFWNAVVDPFIDSPVTNYCLVLMRPNCVKNIHHNFEIRTFNKKGYDSDGFDLDGFDLDGYNKDGLDKYGEHRNSYIDDGCRACY